MNEENMEFARDNTNLSCLYNNIYIFSIINLRTGPHGFAFGTNKDIRTTRYFLKKILLGILQTSQFFGLTGYCPI